MFNNSLAYIINHSTSLDLKFAEIKSSLHPNPQYASIFSPNFVISFVWQ